MVEDGAIRGVVAADGSEYFAGRVILATGTFLGGKTFRGEVVAAEGRFGEAPAIGLAHALRALGFPTRRLKTGTPPRIDRTTVDASRMAVQAPSDVPLVFVLQRGRIRRPAAPVLPHRNQRAHAQTRAR